MKYNIENIAFAMMRLHPIHNGHFNLITKMLKENDLVIIGVGSAQVSGTFDNPFTVAQRLEMFKILFGQNIIGKHSKLKIVAIEDIGAVIPMDWTTHCFNKIESQGLPLPTRYYAGSDMDAIWFKSHEKLTPEKEIYYQSQVFGKENSEQYKEVKEYSEVELEIIVLDRKIVSINSSGTEIRKSIANGFNEWKEDVPECLHRFIIESFPKKFMLNDIIKTKNLFKNK